MKTRKLRLLCLILCLAVCLSLLPVFACATDVTISADGIMTWSADPEISKYYLYFQSTNQSGALWIEGTEANLKEVADTLSLAPGEYTVYLKANLGDVHYTTLWKGTYDTSASFTDEVTLSAREPEDDGSFRLKVENSVALYSWTLRLYRNTENSMTGATYLCSFTPDNYREKELTLNVSGFDDGVPAYYYYAEVICNGYFFYSNILEVENPNYKASQYPDGLNNVNGTWYYYKNNAVQTSYTGLVYYSGTWYYVQKGVLNWGVTTLTQYNGTWYYVSNSQVNWKYTGLTQYYSTTYYIQGGVLKWGVNGLTNCGGTWAYLKNSAVDTSVTTLVQYNGTWYYVQKGILNWGVTTLVQFNGTWYYVQNSTLKWGVTTLVYYQHNWFYVRNSAVDWSFTGIVPYNGSRYYVQGGMIKWGYNGVVRQDGKWYTVENSVVTKISNTAPPSGRNTL